MSGVGCHWEVLGDMRMLGGTQGAIQAGGHQGYLRAVVGMKAAGHSAPDLTTTHYCIKTAAPGTLPYLPMGGWLPW